MTIADIKEYIDEVENKYLKAELIPIFTNANLEEIITNLKSMLDELEPKENDTLALFTNTLDAHIGTHSKIINIELPQEQAIRIKESILESIKVDQSKFLKDKTDNTTEWIKLTTHGMTRFQCKKCDSIFSLPWEHCPKCGRKVTNNIKTNVHKYNYETGKLEELK